MSYNSPFTGNVVQPTDVSYRAITLSANTQLEWPINGNATDDYAARIMEVTATAGSLLLEMPPANQASVGNDALIRNVGANTFTVADYDGNTIVSVAAGQAKYIYIETNPDEAGTWGVIAFGVGTSNVDAATLAGYGLLASGNTLNQSHPVSTSSADFTLGVTHRAQTIVWTGGAGTITLTSGATLGNNWFALIRNGGTGTVTIAPSGGQLIDSDSSLALQPADSCFVICSGAAFFTIGIGRSTEFNFTQLTKSVTNGSYTLTPAEASNVVQKYTGTLAGNVTVVLPQTIQVYYITNQTDATPSNFDVTFTTGVSGSGTAIVPAGQQAILLCDSVNLLNASTIAAGIVNPQLSDGTASVPSLSFANEASTGIYRPGSGEFAITILGTQRLDVTATGISVTGAGAFTGAVSGTTGTFTSGVSGGTY
jgi:hypothetical protein